MIAENLTTARSFHLQSVTSVLNATTPPSTPGNRKFMGVNGLWPLYDGRMVRKI